MEMDFLQFEQYIQLLAVQHKEVNHVDGENTGFTRFQSEEDLLSIPHTAGNIIVGIGNFTGRAVGAAGEGKLQPVADLIFIVHAGPAMVGINVQQALSKAFRIMIEFYSRMVYDFENDDCGPLRGLIPESMTFQPIEGAVLDSYYGWEMSIPFKIRTPDYDPAKWVI